MSTRINTNIEALNAQRNLSVTASKYASSVEKLSSGLRINRAADDAAGLAISEKLQAQVTGLNQAQRNAQDGVSMVQTAEGALNEVHSMLQRVRELSVEAANSTLGQSDAQSVNAEVTALQAEITRIASTTTFNGQNLLTGALSVAQTGGTVGAGFVVAAGTNTSVRTSSSSGAKASHHLHPRQPRRRRQADPVRRLGQQPDPDPPGHRGQGQPDPQLCQHGRLDHGRFGGRRYGRQRLRRSGGGRRDPFHDRHRRKRRGGPGQRRVPRLEQHSHGRRQRHLLHGGRAYPRPGFHRRYHAAHRDGVSRNAVGDADNH